MQGQGWTRRRRAAAWAMLLAVVCVLAWAERAAAVGGAWRWPVRGELLTCYSNDNARPYAGGMHRGIDIGAPVGTPVSAATAGTVTYAGVLGSSGRTVAVRSRSGGTVATYLHLSSIAVRRGEAVEAGERLGAVGTSGRRSVAAPHLHFGIHSAARPDFYYDPLEFLPPPTAGRPGGSPAPDPAPAPVRPQPAPVGLPRPQAAPRPLPAGARQPGGEPSGARGRLPRSLTVPGAPPLRAGPAAGPGYLGRGPAEQPAASPLPTGPTAGADPRPRHAPNGVPAGPALLLPVAATLVLLAILGPPARRRVATLATGTRELGAQARRQFAAQPPPNGSPAGPAADLSA